MNAKNPLYVVKGSQVEAAANWFDLFIKKFDLEPVVAFLQQLLSMLMAQIQSYPLLVMINEYINGLMDQVEAFLGKFNRA